MVSKHGHPLGVTIVEVEQDRRRSRAVRRVEANDLTGIAGGQPAAGSPSGYLTSFTNQGPTARVIYQAPTATSGN